MLRGSFHDSEKERKVFCVKYGVGVLCFMYCAETFGKTETLAITQYSSVQKQNNTSAGK